MGIIDVDTLACLYSFTGCMVPTIIGYMCVPNRKSHQMTQVKNKAKGAPRQAEVAHGVPGRLRSRIFLTFRHYKGGRSSAIRTGRLYPRRNP